MCLPIKLGASAVSEGLDGEIEIKSNPVIDGGKHQVWRIWRHHREEKGGVSGGLSGGVSRGCQGGVKGCPGGSGGCPQGGRRVRAGQAPSLYLCGHWHRYRSCEGVDERDDCLRLLEQEGAVPTLARDRLRGIQRLRDRLRDRATWIKSWTYMAKVGVRHLGRDRQISPEGIQS